MIIVDLNFVVIVFELEHVVMRNNLTQGLRKILLYINFDHKNICIEDDIGQLGCTIDLLRWWN